ncbi:MAG: undecaprenyldiphospho-muramoylpentapeptide beta-N-acetylglucosaminyltransferase [Plesiomonas sp.]|uniref:undecaprenyldiphospho-muramoylpentapeptide beta-N-acetylglucosaminyltransferase n=1 Tax=Plesiomonas sp. TaxID=2486279 RepID=UPI003EE5BC50
MKAKRLLVMAGGTGGHVFPGLAVAHQLMEQGWQVRWLGTADRMEADLVPKHGIEISFIQITGLRGKGLKAQLSAPLRIWRAIKQARAIMAEYQPDVVLGMGGYVSGPGGIAAWLLGIPVVLHEQNAIAGLTNRWLSKIAARVLQAFPGAFAQADVVGNPVRTDVLALPAPETRYANRQGALRVLVIGGSQGARVLNQTVPKAAALLGDKICLWHQVGKGALNSTAQDYQQAGVECQITDSEHPLTQPVTENTLGEFIDDMAAAYAWADVVICRSGALTVSELAAAGLPAIFVPFQHKDRQQYLNGLTLAQAGAAMIIEQDQLTAESLVQHVLELDRTRLIDMAQKARRVAIPDATQRVCTVITALADKRS